MAHPLEEFHPSRGLHQGDPISPYLFLIEVGALYGLLKQSHKSSYLHGLKVAPTTPIVNHLLFSDDSLLFIKASVEGATEVNEVMENYCNAPGQRINLNKFYDDFFSKAILSVPSEMITEKSLGFPQMWGDPRMVLLNI
jgi:hypothetical protein